MKTIWVAHRGEYSDRHIMGIFSSKEKAAAYITEMQSPDPLEIRRYHNPIQLEEWSIDTLLPPPGMHSYNIAMTKEGDTIHVGRAFCEPENDNVHECPLRDLHYHIYDYHLPPNPTVRRDEEVSGSPYSIALRTVCWARDEEHAVKIANERRVAYLFLQIVTVPA